VYHLTQPIDLYACVSCAFQRGSGLEQQLPRHFVGIAPSARSCALFRLRCMARDMPVCSLDLGMGFRQAPAAAAAAVHAKQLRWLPTYVQLLLPMS
jgi:hypothetical protein